MRDDRPGLVVGGGHSDPLFSQLLNDEPVGIDDAEYGQMRTITGEEERWTTTPLENVVELKAVLTKVQKHAKTTNIILNKKLSKGIHCPSRRVAPPFAEHGLVLEAEERNEAPIEPFVHNAIRTACPSRCSLS